MKKRVVVYRYEYRNFYMWFASLLCLLIFCAMAISSIIAYPSFLNIIIFMGCSFLILAQIRTRILKRIPYLEIDCESLEWGYTNYKYNRLYFNNISKILVDCGTDDNDIIVIEKLGIEHRIAEIYFYNNTKELKKVLKQYQSKFQFDLLNWRENREKRL